MYAKHGHRLARQLNIPVLTTAKVGRDQEGNITPTFFLVDSGAEEKETNFQTQHQHQEEGTLPAAGQQQQQDTATLSVGFSGNKAGQLVPDESMLVKYLSKKGFTKDEEGWEGRRTCKVFRCSSDEANAAISGGSRDYVAEHTCRKTKEKWTYRMDRVSVVQVCVVPQDSLT